MADPIYDTATSGTVTNTNSVTFSLTVGAGINRVLYVFITIWHNAAAQGNPTGVTYAGVSATQEADSGFSTGNDRVYIYRLINPATGANNVVASFNSGALGNAGLITAISIANAHQTTPTLGGNSAIGSSTGPTVNAVAGTTSAHLVLDGVVHDFTGSPTLTMVVDAGRTQITNAVGNGEKGATSREESAAASETMNWTISVSRTWAMGVVTVQAPAGAATSLPPARRSQQHMMVR